MVGLDAAGKTTILYKLKLGEIVTTIPTIGKFRYSLSNQIVVARFEWCAFIFFTISEEALKWELLNANCHAFVRSIQVKSCHSPTLIKWKCVSETC